MKNIKNILLIIFAFILMGLAWYTGYKYQWTSNTKETSAVVVLEKVQKVFKLVTVEGHLSEIYKHKDYDIMDVSFFRKKALVRVNARVSAGFDFEKVKLTVDEQSKTIIIEDFPNAEILSMDHDLDYYDITQGSFNKFTSQDYNEINKSVKEFVKSKAIESEILDSAEAQKDDILEMLKTIIQATGWKVLIKNQEELLLG